jgi:uncharacterized protein (DUF1697 family)
MIDFMELIHYPISAPPGSRPVGAARHATRGSLSPPGPNITILSMAVFIALLRAVNVGGTGKLPMADFKTICEAAGCAKVRTYIASGNAVFESKQSEADLKAALEAGLEEYAGKPVRVLVRTRAEMAAVLKANPFPKAAANRTVAVFLDDPPPVDTISFIAGRNGEGVALGLREIYVHYGDGMAGSKLKIPAAKTGTARNMNTVAKLIKLANEL